jgi:hypothetical protein
MILQPVPGLGGDQNGQGSQEEKGDDSESVVSACCHGSKLEFFPILELTYRDNMGRVR